MQSTNPKPEKPVLFWSGGKDSYLALLEWQSNENPEPILITTYDDESGVVPFQEIPINRIQRQALKLELPLITIPLSYPVDNRAYLSTLKIEFTSAPYRVTDLIFGDIHLQDIREWREKEFGDLGFKCHFPIWEKSTEELLTILEKQKKVTVKLRSVSGSHRNRIKPGMTFSRKFIESLPDDIDPFGEYGEFHTEVIFD
jgi:diphthamide synthase (EF-2-diphthine--ammonia ligase)